MARKVQPIMKTVKGDGTQMNVACTDCGKDMCPLTRKPGIYPAPEFKNCAACRGRKNGTRSGHSRRPPPGFVLVSKASVPDESVPPAVEVEVDSAA